MDTKTDDQNKDQEIEEKEACKYLIYQWGKGTDNRTIFDNFANYPS